MFTVVRTYDEFSLQILSICQRETNLEKHYNDDFVAVHGVIDSFVRNENSGLVILHGKQGTGKTSYIRNIITSTNKKVIYINGDMAQDLTDPGFIPFLIKQKNSIVVIEDCEQLLSSRANTSGGVNSGLINVLNISDGLLGDALRLKFICTFNAPLQDIDKALLRKGRLVARYEFCDLSAAKANALIEAEGLDIPLQTSPISLAELYNYEEPSFEQQSRKKIGF